MYNSVYPVNIKPYVPPRVVKKPASSGEEESKGAELQKENQSLQSTDSYNGKTDSYNGKKYEQQEFPNGKKQTIDYSKSKVNIAQIITDFKNTSQAIATPDYIAEEVYQYLDLVEKQSLKDVPNKKLMQTNLKSAATILDDFISQTLNKKSKVVENWVEALFLQQVNYKNDPDFINPDFLVRMPDQKEPNTTIQAQKVQTTDNAVVETETIAETKAVETIPEAEIISAPQAQTQTEITAVTNPISENKVYIPSDPDLRMYFIQGKKYVEAENTDKALAAFGLALSQAQVVEDKQAVGMVCYEIGQIYDKEDNIEEALSYYHRSLTNSTDNNLKVKAYYAMAQIYNDVVYFEPAMDHYYAAISYAGESENLKAQTKALSDIANMYADRYDKDTTRKYFDTAKEIVLETNENKTIGAIYAKSGDTMKRLDENVTALNDYKESTRYYEMAESPIKMAKNYEKASQVMSKLGNTEKSRSLLQKACNIALASGDKEYAEELTQQYLEA